ncbi:hypothetical protein [Krasilnikovia sp. M28-CT-15]|uniref:hypothetical protein n=1 Tax=Krasilnikovia sp. M28-CT-15 TaxID=3373540 RepID=UPI00399D17A6
MRRLLDEKYGPGHVPGVRAISADIRAANGGETVSHGHIHNILKGEADNLTDRTRRLLATFFGRQLADFLPPEDDMPGSPGQGVRPAGGTGPDARTVQALAGRFATFAPEQIAAIRQAVEIVTAQQQEREGR